MMANSPPTQQVQQAPLTQRPSLQIDFVSDVACPWCAVGVNALEQAMERVKDEVRIELEFQPFELNPQMDPEGEDSGAYADEVRQALALWQQAGIRSVPSIVINRRHLIQGGQPVDVFEQALHELARATVDHAEGARGAANSA